MLAFLIPRVPDFQINQDEPLAQATGDFNKSVPVYFNRAPANFSFPAQADLQIDTHSNFLPLTFTKLHAEVFDLETSRQIAVGDLGHMTFPAKQFTQLSVPLNFSYVASNTSDQTCKWPKIVYRPCCCSSRFQGQTGTTAAETKRSRPTATGCRSSSGSFSTSTSLGSLGRSTPRPTSPTRHVRSSSR